MWSSIQRSPAQSEANPNLTHPPCSPFVIWALCGVTRLAFWSRKQSARGICGHRRTETEKNHCLLRVAWSVPSSSLPHDNLTHAMHSDGARIHSHTHTHTGCSPLGWMVGQPTKGIRQDSLSPGMISGRPHTHHPARETKSACV